MCNTHCTAAAQALADREVATLVLQVTELTMLLLLLLLSLAAVALKPDVFEGLRFEITRPLNQNFFLTHRCARLGLQQQQQHQLQHQEYNNVSVHAQHCGKGLALRAAS
jgi:hypothetical protein